MNLKKVTNSQNIQYWHNYQINWKDNDWTSKLKKLQPKQKDSNEVHSNR